MKARFVLGMALGFCGAIVTLAGDGAWTGYVTDSHCGVKGASEKHAQCAAKCVKEQGASYVFVNDADHKVYNVDNQDKVAAHVGHHVTVKGTADGDTLKVASVDMAK